jgi:hypothetical protein
MKLCKDCKWYEEQQRVHPLGFCLIDVGICTRNSLIELVKGEKRPPFLNCETEREDALRLEEFRCGKEGKFWEAK